MKIAIALFDRFTALDAIGPYEVLSRLPGAEIVFVGEAARTFRTDMGMAVVAGADGGRDQLPVSHAVPGVRRRARRRRT